ncbi:MAG: hypothetical protein GVY16_07555 [Planctomycetes bacterium]|nr:hypothetical protein [Planctomycetota bacterium]
MKCAIRKGNVDAQIVEARLDGEVYQPGDTVKGYALIEPFREDRRKVPFTLKVPGDLPDGEYPLTVGDAMVGLHLQQQAQPQRFEPRTPRQLLRAVQRVVQPKRDRLHLHLEIPDGSGLAIGKTELPDLPASKADLLRGLDVPDTFATQGAITKTVESDYVLQGRKELTVTVKKHPNETPVRR